jgi:hypothetical protein
LSGHYANAEAAAKRFDPARVTVVDSRSATPGEGLPLTMEGKIEPVRCVRGWKAAHAGIGAWCFLSERGRNKRRNRSL